jgi:hypothetical protein
MYRKKSICSLLLVMSSTAAALLSTPVDVPVEFDPELDTDGELFRRA